MCCFLNIRQTRELQQTVRHSFSQHGSWRQLFNWSYYGGKKGKCVIRREFGNMYAKINIACPIALYIVYLEI